MNTSSDIEPSSEAPGSSPDQVAGVQIPRALPRTGMDPGLLLMFGGMLVVSGVLLMRYSSDAA